MDRLPRANALAMTDEGGARNDVYPPQKTNLHFIVKHNIINVLYCAKLYRLNQGFSTRPFLKKQGTEK